VARRSNTVALAGERLRAARCTQAALGAIATAAAAAHVEGAHGGGAGVGGAPSGLAGTGAASLAAIATRHAGGGGGLPIAHGRVPVLPQGQQPGVWQPAAGAGVPAGGAAPAQRAARDLEVRQLVTGAIYDDSASAIAKFVRLASADSSTSSRAATVLRAARTYEGFKASLLQVETALISEGQPELAAAMMSYGADIVHAYNSYVQAGGLASFSELADGFDRSAITARFADYGDGGGSGGYTFAQLIYRAQRDGENKAGAALPQGPPGPPGPMGPQGPRGQMGPQGAQGRAGAVAVGMAAPFGGGGWRGAGGGSGGGRGGGRGGGDGRAARVPEALRARARAENWANVDQVTWGALDPSKCWRCNGARHGLAGACANPIPSA
jgi:hypothetical protein